MADQVNGHFRDRLADLEMADRCRRMESTLKPLVAAEASRDSELVAVPLDVLIGRFYDIERAIADARRDFAEQVEFLRTRSRRIQRALTILVLAVGAILLWVGPRLPIF